MNRVGCMTGLQVTVSYQTLDQQNLCPTKSQLWLVFYHKPFYGKALAKWSQHVNTSYHKNVGCNILHAFGHHVGCCWLKFENGPVGANNTQHITICHNMVAKCMQHAAPNNDVVIVWPGLKDEQRSTVSKSSYFWWCPTDSLFCLTNIVS